MLAKRGFYRLNVHNFWGVRGSATGACNLGKGLSAEIKHDMSSSRSRNMAHGYLQTQPSGLNFVERPHNS